MATNRMIHKWEKVNNCGVFIRQSIDQIRGKVSPALCRMYYWYNFPMTPNSTIGDLATVAWNKESTIKFYAGKFEAKYSKEG